MILYFTLCFAVYCEQWGKCWIFLQECCRTREAGAGGACVYKPESSEVDRLQEESVWWYGQEICAHQPEGKFEQLRDLYIFHALNDVLEMFPFIAGLFK